MQAINPSVSLTVPLALARAGASVKSLFIIFSSLLSLLLSCFFCFCAGRCRHSLFSNRRASFWKNIKLLFLLIKKFIRSKTLE